MWLKNFIEFSKWQVELGDKVILSEEVLLFFLTILIFLGNALVLVATWRERSLHQPNKYFIACLAVADLLVGMFLIPLRLYERSQVFEWPPAKSIHLCRFITWMDTFALAASIYSLTFISFDRYFKISKPLQYRIRMTTSKSVKIIFTIWLISTAFATYAATPHSGSTGIFVTSSFCPFDENRKKGFYTFLAVSAFCLPTIVIVVMYARIFVVLQKRKMMLRNGELGQTPNDRNQRTAFLQDMKVIRMFVVVVGMFVLAWAPYFVWKLGSIYHPFIDSLSTSKSYWRRVYISLAIITLLPYFNSLCNPIIYACMDRRYKEAFKNLFKRILCRRSSRRRRRPEGIQLGPLGT